MGKPNRVFCEICEKIVNNRISHHELTAKHLKALVAKNPSLLQRVLRMTKQGDGTARENGRRSIELQVNEQLAGTGVTVEVK